MDGTPKRTLLLTARYAAAGIARQALSVLLIPIYTRFLGLEDFGILALLTISGTLVIRTIETPLGGALQRFYFRPDYEHRRPVFLFNLVLFAVLNALAVVALYVLAGEAIGKLLFGDARLANAVRLHGLVVAFSATTSLAGIFVLLLEKSRIYVVASFLNVLVTGIVSVALLAVARMGVTAVIVGQAAGLLFQTLLCLPALRGHVRAVVDWNVLREPLRFGYATLISGYSNILIIAGDRYMLRLLRTVQEVGLYSFGCNIGNIVTLAVGTPLISGVWPTIRRMESEPDAQREFACRVTTFAAVAATALAVALSVFAPEMIWLLASRPDFAAAASVVPLLAFSQALQGLAAFTEAGIVLGNRPGHVSAVAFSSAAVNILLNLILIPMLGLVGAGWATLISFVVWNGLNVHYSARFYGLRFDVRRLAHAMLLGGAIATLGTIVSSQFGGWWLWPAKGLLLLAYPVLLFATGFLNPDERRTLREFVRKPSHRASELIVARAEP
jgi:O-antigen/teichoic acid export membrane protein